MTPHIEPAWAAGKLVARFVAHVGEVATQTIRQRPKLIGIDVILVHRMLKSPSLRGRWGARSPSPAPVCRTCWA